jgi:hypothetical protein
MEMRIVLPEAASTSVLAERLTAVFGGGGGPTPWHQDQYYWPLESDRTVTMWMPLVDIAAEMGGMEFGSGTQRRPALAELAISDESEAFFERMAASGEFPVTRPVPMAAGDATFHAGWTLHRADGCAIVARVTHANSTKQPSNTTFAERQTSPRGQLQKRHATGVVTYRSRAREDQSTAETDTEERLNTCNRSCSRSFRRGPADTTKQQR